MDPATLALTAAGLLAKKALEAAGGKAGEGAWATLGRIAETIRAKFRGDPEATEALNRLEAKPDQQLTELIGQLHQRSRGTYGAPGSSLAGPAAKTCCLAGTASWWRLAASTPLSQSP
jgi:hypothetical protein